SPSQPGRYGRGSSSKPREYAVKSASRLSSYGSKPTVTDRKSTSCGKTYPVWQGKKNDIPDRGRNILRLSHWEQGVASLPARSPNVASTRSRARGVGRFRTRCA